MRERGFSVGYIRQDYYDLIKRKAIEEDIKITRLLNDIFEAGLRVKRMLPPKEEPLPQEAA